MSIEITEEKTNGGSLCFSFTKNKFYLGMVCVATGQDGTPVIVSHAMRDKRTLKIKEARNIESEQAAKGFNCFQCGTRIKRGELCAYYYTPDKYAMDDFVCMPCARKLPAYKEGESESGVRIKEVRA